MDSDPELGYNNMIQHDTEIGRKDKIQKLSWIFEFWA